MPAYPPPGEPPRLLVPILAELWAVARLDWGQQCEAMPLLDQDLGGDRRGRHLRPVRPDRTSNLREFATHVWAVLRIRWLRPLPHSLYLPAFWAMEMGSARDSFEPTPHRPLASAAGLDATVRTVQCDLGSLFFAVGTANAQN